MPLLPPAFLFRFSLPVRSVAALPRKETSFLQLPANCALPDLSGFQESQPFGDLRLAWNSRGLGVSVSVKGKQRGPRCEPRMPEQSDGLQLWIDTRNTQNIHRASRFCHHFCILPGGNGPQKDEPFARQLPIVRAREEAPLCDPDDLELGVEWLEDGYALDVWFPSHVLHGYEPDTNPRLGFYYWLRDSELGDQFLSVGLDFPFTYDPSLWWTLELV